MLADYLMGPLKRYLTQMLSTSLSKYISNINVETLGVGGDIILRDLELRLDVLQEVLKIPLTFEFSRGFIKELRIQIHWTKLFSQPIHVKVSTIEIILTARSEIQFRRLQLAYQRNTSKLASQGTDSPALGASIGGASADRNGSSTPRKSTTNPTTSKSSPRPSEPRIEDPSLDGGESGGWLADAIRKVVANATVEINDLVLKYEHANVVLSTSFRSLRVASADPGQDWKLSFQEPEGLQRSIFKSIEMRDLTINLDRIASESVRRASGFGSSMTPRGLKGASRHRGISDSSGESLLENTPKRGTNRNRGTFELPILRRASISIRARVSTDPFASRASSSAAPGQGNGSESFASRSAAGRAADDAALKSSSSSSSLSVGSHQNPKRTRSFESRMSIRRSSSENGHFGKGDPHGKPVQDAEIPDTNLDPFHGVPCLLPLLCEPETELWRARKNHDPEHPELEWAIISIADVYVRKLDLSVSNEQFVMLEELMVLPDEDEEEEEVNNSVESESNSKRKGVRTSIAIDTEVDVNTNVEDNPDEEDAIGGQTNPQDPGDMSEPEEARAGSDCDNNDRTGSPGSKEDSADDTGSKSSEGDLVSPSASQQGWGSWAWGFLVGDVDEELDDVEVEMLYDAAETAKRREAARIKAIKLARERKRLITVAGARVETITFTFLMHKNVNNVSDGDAIDPRDPTGSDADQIISVPVANVGMVQVRLDHSQDGSLLGRDKSQLSKSNKLEELLRLSVHGITLEARKVDDLIENHPKAFVDIYADVDLVRVTRYEPSTSTHHDVALWGETPFNAADNTSSSSLLDTMPHPWFCWSFFQAPNAMFSYPEHCEKECCVGSSLYRRSDKAVRFHCHAPTGQIIAPESSGNPAADTNTPVLVPPTTAIYVDTAVGPVSCRVDLLTVEGLYEFFGLSAASPDDLGTRSGLPQFRKGTAGAALKELAAEYASLTKPQKLKSVARPIEALATFPRVVGSFSTVPANATREDLYPSLGVVVRDTALRFGTNLHRAERGSFAKAKGAPTPPMSLFPPHVFDQLTHRATEVSRTDRKTMSLQCNFGHATVFLAQRPSKLEHKPKAPHQRESSGKGGGGAEASTFDAILVQLVQARSLVGMVAPVDPKENGHKARLRMDLSRFLAQANVIQVCQAVEVVSYVLRPVSSAAAAPADPLFLHHDAEGLPGVALNVDTFRADASLDGLAKGLASSAFSLGGVHLHCHGKTVASMQATDSASTALSGHAFGEGHPVTAALQRISFATRLLSRSVVAKFHDNQQHAHEARLGFGFTLGNAHIDAVSAFSLLEWGTNIGERISDILRVYVGQRRSGSDKLVVEPLDDFIEEDMGILSMSGDGPRIPHEGLPFVDENIPEMPPVTSDVITDIPYPRSRRSSSLLPWIQGTRVFLHVDVTQGSAFLSSTVRFNIPAFRLLQNGREHNDFRWQAGPLVLQIRGRNGFKNVLRDAHFHGSCSCALGESVELKLSVHSELIYLDLDPERIASLTSLLGKPMFKMHTKKSGKGSPANQQQKSKNKQTSTDWPAFIINLQGELAGCHINMYPLSHRQLTRTKLGTPYQIADHVEIVLEYMQFSLWQDLSASSIRFSIRDLYVLERMQSAYVQMPEVNIGLPAKNTLKSMPSRTLGIVIAFLTPRDIISLASAYNISLNSANPKEATQTFTDSFLFSSSSIDDETSFFDRLDQTIPVVCSPAIHAIPSNKPTLLSCSVSKSSRGRLLIEGGLLPIDLVLRPGLLGALVLLSSYVRIPGGSTASNKNVRKRPHNNANKADNTGFKWPQVQLQLGRIRVFLPCKASFAPYHHASTTIMFVCDAVRASQTTDGVGATCTIGSISMSTCNLTPNTMLNEGEQISFPGAIEAFYAHVYHYEIQLDSTTFLHPMSMRVIIGPSGHVEVDADEFVMHASLHQVRLLQSFAEKASLLSNLVWLDFLLDPDLRVSDALIRHVVLKESKPKLNLPSDALSSSSSDLKNDNGELDIIGNTDDTNRLTERSSFSLSARAPGLKIRIEDTEGGKQGDMVYAWTSELRFISGKETCFEIQNWGVDAGGRVGALQPCTGSQAALSITMPHNSSVVLEFVRGVQCALDGDVLRNLNRLLVPDGHLPDHLTDIQRVISKYQVFRKARRLVTMAQEDLIACEETDAGAKIKGNVKLVLSSLDVSVFINHSLESPCLHLTADQVFFQQALRGKRSEFEVVVIRSSLAASTTAKDRMLLVEPTDLRFTGTQLLDHTQRISLAIETSTIDASVSLESLATVVAVAEACTPPPLAAAAKALSVNIAHRANIAANAAQESPFFNPSVPDVTNDFVHLKRIYEMGDAQEFVHPAPGQIILGAVGIPGAVVGCERAWSLASNSDPDHGLEAGGQWNQTFSPLSAASVGGWVTLRWQYFEPRVITSIGILNPPPIPRGVAEAAIHPSGVKAGVIECQLAYWDAFRSSFVVIATFNVPLEEEALSTPSRRAAVEEFVDAFSNLVDMSMNEDTSFQRSNFDRANESGRKTKLEASSFPQQLKREDPAKMWILRWRAAVPKEKGNSAVDDRLAVCSALARSLNVQSKSSLSYWYPMDVQVSARNLRLAVLRNASLNSRNEEVLFVVRAKGFNVLSQQRVKEAGNVRVSADLEVHVQDFGHLSLLHFTRIHHLAIMHEMNAANRAESIWVDCRHWRWNISKQTLPAVHYAVLAFVRDMENLPKRSKEITSISMGEDKLKTKNVEGKPLLPSDDKDDGASLQYRLVNSTGRTVWYGQYGTAEVLRLDADAASSYSWRITSTHLHPSSKDQALLRHGVPESGWAKIDEQLDARMARAAAFEPLMRFALSSDRGDDQPGTWSRPISIDTIGVHLRSLIFGGVSKNENSVFFGNEPQTRLWVSAQRGENGLQTIIRLLPSHFILNRVPEPLQIRFSSTTRELPACDAQKLHDTFVGAEGRDKDTELPYDGVNIPRLSRLSSSSSIKSIGPDPSSNLSRTGKTGHIDSKDVENVHNPVGFIDEQDIDFAFSGAGALALMCPDVDLLASMDSQAQDRAEKELSFQVGRQIDWSEPISLLHVNENEAPTLVEVPGPLGVPSMWLWVHVRRAHIRAPSGGRIRSWVMVEIWPTAYVCNDAPWPITCQIRPQNRLELLQYALTKQESDFSRGDWPLLKEMSLERSKSSSSMNAATLPNDASGSIASSTDHTENTSNGKVSNSSNSEGAIVSNHRVWTIPANSISALFVHPTVPQALRLASVEDKNATPIWLSPALRIHEMLFANCISSFGASLNVTSSRIRMSLARHEAALQGGLISIQASALSGYSSLFMHVSPPVMLCNESESRLYFRYGEHITVVEKHSKASVAWRVDAEEANSVCVGRQSLGEDGESIVWSSPLLLNDDDQQIVALPVLESVKDASHAAWVAQYWFEMNRNADGQIVITTRDRVIIHNRMKQSVRVRLESLFSEALDEVLIEAGGSWSPLSFFCDVQSDQGDKIGGASNEISDADSETEVKSADPTTAVLERRSSGFSEWILNRSQRSASASSVSSLLGIGFGGHAEDESSEKDVLDQKLLSTVMRLSTEAAPDAWTEPLRVRSLEIDRAWKQLVQLYVTPRHLETITCMSNEIDGVVHLALQRETQPECVVMNRTQSPITVGLGNQVLKSSWQNTALPQVASYGLYLPPMHSATVNWLALSKRVREPLFEVMKSGQDEEQTIEDEQSGEDLMNARRFILEDSGAAPGANSDVNPNMHEAAQHIQSKLVGKNLVKDYHLCIIEENDSEWTRRPSEVFEGQQKHEHVLLFRRSVEIEDTDRLSGVVQEMDANSNEHSSVHRELGRKTVSSEQLEVVMTRPHAWWEVEIFDVNQTQDAGMHNIEDSRSESQNDKSAGPASQRESSNTAVSPFNKSRRLQVLATVSDLEVCLFDQALETVHLRVAGLEVSHFMVETRDARSWRDVTINQTVAGRAQWIQMDSFVPESEIPVVMHFMEVESESEAELELCNCGYSDPLVVSQAHRQTWILRDRILAAASWTEVKSAGQTLPMQFGKVHLRLAPLIVAVEDALLKRLATSLMPIAATLIAQQKLLLKKNGVVGKASPRLPASATSECPAQLMDVDDRIFIENLVIEELSIIATVRTTTLPMFVGIDRTPIRLSEVALVRVFEGINALRNELLAHYIADALLGSPALLGSLEILGNPVGFARSVGAGVYDLFFQPLKAIRHGYGPGGILRSVARGWSSLLIHLSEGALMSVSGFSSSVARNLDRLSMDSAYATRREQMRRRRTYSSGGRQAMSMRVAVMLRETLNEQEEAMGYWATSNPETNFEGGVRHLHDVSSSSRALALNRDSMRYGTARGLARGVMGLGQGMFGAATGIVVQPFEVAQQQGWGVGSVLQGVGRGLLGALTKPIGGAADLVAQTSGGIMQDAGIGSAAGPSLMRERSILASVPHHSLRFNWKLLPEPERYVHHERARQLSPQARLVVVVVTSEMLRLYSLLDGTDTLPLASWKWSHVAALETSFKDAQQLTIRLHPSVSSKREVVLVFASKQDRRLLVKQAVMYQRSAHEQLM